MYTSVVNYSCQSYNCLILVIKSNMFIYIYFMIGNLILEEDAERRAGLMSLLSLQ